MFAYCLNNPVAYQDSAGTIAYTCMDDGLLFSEMYFGACTGGGGFGRCRLSSCAAVGNGLTEDDLIPDYTETVSIVATTSVGDATASKSLSLSSDSSGNHAIQTTSAFGATTGIEAGIGLTYTATNAKTVFDLEGESTNIGFSFGVKYVFSLDVVYFNPASDPSSTKWGICIGIGAGAALETHAAIANTETLVSWTPDWWKELMG